MLEVRLPYVHTITPTLILGGAVTVTASRVRSGYRSSSGRFFVGSGVLSLTHSPMRRFSLETEHSSQTSLKKVWCARGSTDLRSPARWKASYSYTCNRRYSTGRTDDIYTIQLRFYTATFSILENYNHDEGVDGSRSPRNFSRSRRTLTQWHVAQPAPKNAEKAQKIVFVPVDLTTLTVITEYYCSRARIPHYIFP